MTSTDPIEPAAGTTEPASPPTDSTQPEGTGEVAEPKPLRFKDVEGWMIDADQWAFTTVLEFQNSTEPPGDVVELGAYKGKSAIVIGRSLRPGETFTVCDLFEDVGSEMSLHRYDRNAYRTLSEAQFVENYLAFHDTLPTIVRGLSSVITEHVPPASCRFVHVDASHMYVNVRIDAASARDMLRPNGVVVFDDFRTEHTIGTANAVWETVINDGLHPICASERKLYATWGDPAPLQAHLLELLETSPDFHHDVHEIVRGESIVRIGRRKKAPAPKPKPKPPVAKPTPPPPPPPPPFARRVVRRLKRELGRR